MTARERVVIRAVIRALNGADRKAVDALCVSYGIPVQQFKPVKDVAATLLIALLNAEHDN